MEIYCPIRKEHWQNNNWKIVIRMSIFLGNNSYHQETVNSIDIVIN
jgi:hypothetical protein